MKRWNLINQILVGAWAMLAMALAYAGAPLWTITPLSPTTLNVSANGIATVKYQVTNQSRKSHTLVMTAIPGITQVTTAGDCPSPFNLAYQQSCILTLQVNGSSLTGNVIGGPIVCQQGNTLQCYRPEQVNQLNITLTSRANQTITYNTLAPSATVGGATYTPVATSSSGLAVTITVDASSTSICSISGGVVSFSAAGTCVLDANQAGNANYNAATQVQQSVIVTQATQATLTAAATPSSIAFNGTSTLSTTGGSGAGVVSYAVTSGAVNCSISGNTLTAIGVGTCSVTATKAADAEYQAATSAPITVTVTQATQVTLIAAATPSSIIYNGTSTLSTTGGSGTGAVSYAVTAGAANCSISGNTLTGTGVGTCSVTATKAADAEYQAVTSAPISVNVVISSSTMVYSSQNPSATSSSVTLSANVSSSNGVPSAGSVGFTADGVSISGCTTQPLSSGIATCTTSSLGAGTHAIVATYTGGAGFTGSTSVSFSQYVVASLDPVQGTVPAAPQDVIAIPSNGQVTVQWYPPANTGGATITGYTVLYGTTASTTYTTPGCTTSSASGLSCTVSGLTNGTPYTFTVAAINGNGTGLKAFSSSVAPGVALTASPSNLALSGLGSSGGIARTITITNNSGSTVTIGSVSAPSPSLPSGTTVDTSQANACASGLALADGGICTLTIAPGATVSTGAGSALCTTGIAPTPSAIIVTDTNLDTVTVNVVVLGYGCQYQGGYLFSIDDTSPAIGSIGGKVVAFQDQATTTWSPGGVGDSIWGTDEISTIAIPSPNASSDSPAIFQTGQLNCNGSTEGACDSNNMIQYPGFGAATTYSAGFCAQPIDSIGNSPCLTGTCYTDWYLPAICDMGGSGPGTWCPSGLANMDTNLYQLGLGGFADYSFYWSSTEYFTNPLIFAMGEVFIPGSSNQAGYNKGFSLGVRCSRALTI